MLYKYVKTQPIMVEQNKRPTRNLFKRSKTIVTLALTALILGSISLLYSVYPYASAAFYNSVDNGGLDRGIITSSLESYVLLDDKQRSGSLSSVYVSNLYKNLASTTKELKMMESKEALEIASKSGDMKLTIPQLNLKSVPIAVNVNSYSEKDYLPILDNKLAHFKGTSLPNYSGNTFVYGHSTNELIARANPTLPQVAFTFLNKLDIGDEIIVELEGKTYNYFVQRSKVVEPEDISPIFTRTDKKTLTLMTCWPPGIGEKRLILVADQV